jgi:hypothetical protein
MHIVPTCGSYTWEKRGAKDVKVLGVEDKRQITACISSSASGDLLLLQLVFTGTTPHCLSKINTGQASCLASGFDLAYSSTYWSTLETCEQFVHQILLPYREKQIVAQKILWLINCWSIHKSAAFLSWVKDNHPCICLVFILANCTSKFQPVDMILQRPLKHAFARKFGHHLSSKIKFFVDLKIEFSLK